MYKVLGIDQKPYGPVSAEVVRRWVRERRAQANTLACAEGTDQWKPLAQFPEFADLFPPQPSPGPGQPGSIAPAPAQPQEPLKEAVRPPVLAGCQGPAGRVAPGVSGLAVAALVCGLLGFCTAGLTALLGLVLGWAGLRRIRRSQGRLAGRGLAVAGLAFSGVALAVWLAILFGEILPRTAQQRAQAQSAQCLNHLLELGVALRRYANDQSDRFPAASNWCDALAPYLDNPNAYECPAGPSRWRCHYAYNARLSAKPDVQVNPKTVAFFEIDGGWNVSGGPERVPRAPRHGVVHVCYVDGTVERVGRDRLAALRWDP